ncbi:MAG: hypothetical protein ACK2UQ_04470 [Anaerolineae bacterium]
MAKIIEAMKAGIKAVADSREPGEYSAGGAKIICPHCENTMFKLHGPFNLQQWGDFPTYIEATLTCLKCGLIQWLGKRPTRL